MNALVVGLGSIGKRHVGCLEELGYTVDVVSSHSEIAKYASLKEVSDLNDYTIIALCSETIKHKEQFEVCVNQDFKGVLFVEKPLGFEVEHFLNSKAVVAYNLRFHTAIEKLKKQLKHKKILSAQFNIERYLPTMRRESRDYSESYSCFKGLGGGVLNDFSHDLDLCLYLLGDWKSLTALGGKISELYGDSEDNVHVLIEMKTGCAVQLHLSYCNHLPSRNIVIECEGESYRLELDSGLYQNSKECVEFKPEALVESYYKQWKSILKESSEVCDLAQAINVEILIREIKEALKSKSWRSRL